MSMDEWRGELGPVVDLPPEAMRGAEVHGSGWLRDDEASFDYRLGFVTPADVRGVLELNHRVCAHQPDAPVLYRREADFFEACAGTGGCLVAAWVGDTVVAYAAARFPERADGLYAETLGFASADVRHVTYLVGSAVARRYRGNRLQTRLTTLRAAYAAACRRWHLCGVVDARNTLSLENHLNVGFLLKGHYVDDFALANFVVHRDMRGAPARLDERVEECRLDDIQASEALVATGRWGFAVERRDGEAYLQFGRFAEVGAT